MSPQVTLATPFVSSCIVIMYIKLYISSRNIVNKLLNFGWGIFNLKLLRISYHLSLWCDCIIERHTSTWWNDDKTRRLLVFVLANQSISELFSWKAFMLRAQKKSLKLCQGIRFLFQSLFIYIILVLYHWSNVLFFYSMCALK